MAQLIPAGLAGWLAANAATITAVSGAATAATSLGTGIAGSIQAGKQPPDPMKKQRALAERMASEGAGRRAIGQQATLLAGASGLTNPANVGKKTLLGG